MMGKLKVYADRMSQPCRAVLIFCRLNGIDFEEIKVDISKRHHLSPEFTEVNPLQKVPAILHGNLNLFESHAILVYLSSAFPGIADHWYPTDVFRRAKINSVLDWHHSNLRYGADLSLVCELTQLEVLDEKDRGRILSPYKKVLGWIEDTRTATNPHFEEMHNILYRAKKKFQQQRSRIAESGTEASNMGGHSKM
ncbi:hypothetical protein TSUD_77050 [Trifolium subterraneum]|uniref:GST N-terminal domain-containing protein n=1 Tax=Trifolium subterraneum TaxID=3900 RepID=A0A2Z6LSP3_TRISU|nr:hypothetical protein TSUD_77050 [Trifolium subterraneum]